MADDTRERAEGRELARQLGADFEVDGVTYLILHPSTEEYDDALTIETIVRAHWMAQPEVQALAEYPCSESERALYQEVLEEARERLAEASPGSMAYKRARAEVRRLERLVEERTLADEIVTQRALLARDRYLCQRLLADEEGNRLMDWSTPAAARRSAEIWKDEISLAVKDAARPAIWFVVGLVRQAPFS